MEGGKIIERGEEERIGSKRGRDEKGKMGRLEKRPSGMVVVEEYSGDEMINGVKYEEKKISSGGGGEGLFNQLITNLVGSPKSNGSVKTDVFEAGSEKKNGGGGGGSDGDVGGGGGGGGGGSGGGVINNLISNIFSSNGGGGGGEEVVEKEGGGGGEVVVEGGEKDDDDGGEDAIDNIVAKLPRTLSEDTVPVPATDEASILLHSIIHD
ncbi:hypothetical protein OSB04_022715 [Centaurea solstitialis]|uniref:Uncharacterized protein n=1 Tax=Centaurea solstitialis TaxID=347529 RepID=A0AA38T2I1_9ASTR|nr:hypothetical protein OSB04_022715 [Centaurea solstitialis]